MNDLFFAGILDRISILHILYPLDKCQIMRDITDRHALDNIKTIFTKATQAGQQATQNEPFYKSRHVCFQYIEDNLDPQHADIAKNIIHMYKELTMYSTGFPNDPNTSDFSNGAGVLRYSA
jgi:hypothetical protein